MRTIIGYTLGAVGGIGLTLTTGAYVNGHITLVQGIICAFASVLALLGSLDVLGDD